MNTTMKHPNYRFIILSKPFFFRWAALTGVIRPLLAVIIQYNVRLLPRRNDFLPFFLTRGTNECILRKIERREWGGRYNRLNNGRF